MGNSYQLPDKRNDSQATYWVNGLVTQRDPDHRLRTITFNKPGETIADFMSAETGHGWSERQDCRRIAPKLDVGLRR